MNKGDLNDYLNTFSELYEKERKTIEEEFSNLKYKKLSIGYQVTGQFKGKKYYWRFNLKSDPPKEGCDKSFQKYHLYEKICNKLDKKYSLYQKLKNVELAAKEAGYDAHASGTIFTRFIISDHIFEKFREQYILFIEDAEQKKKDGTIEKAKAESSFNRQKNGAIAKLKNKINEAYSKGVELEEIINLAKELNIKHIQEQ